MKVGAYNVKPVYSDIYLVDCENVGLRRYEVTDSDNILIYYFTRNHSSLSCLEPYERVININCVGIKNALDFIIDSKLGHLLCYYGRKVDFHIISRDKGYDTICAFWTNQGYSVVRNDSLILDNKVSKINLKFKYNIISSVFTQSQRLRLRNIYQSWARSKLRDYNNLKCQISRSFCKYGLTVIEIEDICNYCYYVGFGG